MSGTPMTVPCELCGERIDITNIEPTPTKWNPPDHVCGQWHTYKEYYDAHIDSKGDVVGFWHGRFDDAPDDDRDLIQCAFDQGVEFDREAVARHLQPATEKRSVWWGWESVEDKRSREEWGFDTDDDAVCYGIALALDQIRKGQHLRGSDG